MFSSAHQEVLQQYALLLQAAKSGGGGASLASSAAAAAESLQRPPPVTFEPFIMSGGAAVSNYSHVRAFPDESAWKCQLKKDKEIQAFMDSGQTQKATIDKYVAQRQWK